MLLYTRGNKFPYNYHPDEPVKVRQLVTGELNFNHPLLLLSTAGWVRDLTQAGEDRQRVVECGRLVSAIFAGLGVVAFMWTAWLKGGPWVALTVTAFLLPHHQVFELAHYLKEDTALFMGIGLTFCALALTARLRKPASVAFMGIAAALALSAKYVGVAGFVVALCWLFFTRSEEISQHRKALIFTFLGTFLIAVLAINYQFLIHLASAQNSFSREMGLVVNGQGGVTRKVPNWQYTAVFLDNTNPIIWLGLLGALFYGWKGRREWSLEQWLPLIFSAAFAVMLSCSPKTNDRYFLPLTGMCCLAAGWGLFRLVGDRTKGRAQWLCVVLALISVFPALAKYDAAFQIDDRRDLSQWIRENVPPSASILQEKVVRLPGTNKREGAPQLPQPSEDINFAADAGSLDEIRSKGITHLVVSQSAYGRYFLASLRPEPAERALFETRKTFYKTLFENGRLLWKRPRSTVIYLHPGLELYDITQPETR